MTRNALTAAQVATRLGVKLPTVYAYVSRGVLSRSLAPDGRTSRFDAAEVDQLARRGRPRPGGGRIGAIEVSVATSITCIRDDRLYYRGHDAIALAARETFESVAELLWTGELGRPGPWDERRAATAREVAGPTARERARPTAREVAGPTPRERTRPTAREVAGPTPRERARPTAREVAGPTTREVVGPTPRESARPTARERTRPTPRIPAGASPIEQIAVATALLACASPLRVDLRPARVLEHARGLLAALVDSVRLRGVAAPARGVDLAPARGVATPARGVDLAPARGVAAPARGVDLAPARGVAAGSRGVDSAPARGVAAGSRGVDSAPARGVDSAPARGVAAPARGVPAPARGVPAPARGVAAPARGVAASARGARAARIAARLWPRLSPLPATAARVALLDAALVLLADHELATSTLAARVAASTRADPFAVVLAGLGAVSGPLHGKAALAAHQLIEAARRAPSVEVLVARTLAGGGMPGFGHPVYRGVDPRARHLLDRLADLVPRTERAVIDDVLAAASSLSDQAPNVDFALGALASGLQMPLGATEAIFAIARIAGWIAHALEEYGEEPLRFRARAIYVGSPPR